MSQAAPRQSRPRVLVLCPYPENVAPSQRLKYEKYLDVFRAAGYEVDVSPFMSMAMWRTVYKSGGTVRKVARTLAGYARRVRDLARLSSYDVVYVHLWVTPFGPPVFERIVRRLSRALVYDVDDMIHIGEEQEGGFVASLKGRSKPLYLMAHADETIVGAPRMAEVARAYTSRLSDISPTIDTDVYQPPVDHLARHEQGRPITIGWSGSHSTSPYLRLLEPVLARLQQKHAFEVVVIGDPAFQFDAVDSQAIPWELDTEVEDLRRIDIGLYPLPDELWVHGKGGGKALQYMALGIPPVATAIGASHRVIEEGVSGFLVNDASEWEARLEQLMTDPELRDRMGREGRKRVESLYSVRANSDTYLEILGRVGRGTGRRPATRLPH